MADEIGDVVLPVDLVRRVALLGVGVRLSDLHLERPPANLVGDFLLLLATSGPGDLAPGKALAGAPLVFDMPTVYPFVWFVGRGSS